MITAHEARKLVKLIERYRDAEVEDSWKGGGDPADIPYIEEELRLARSALEQYIVQLQLPNGG